MKPLTLLAVVLVPDAVTQQSDDALLQDDLRELRGPSRQRVHVLSLDVETARCQIIGGAQVTLRITDLEQAYRLVERKYVPRRTYKV